MDDQLNVDFSVLDRPRASSTSGFYRMPAIVGRGMAATSHPLATRAAVTMLERGGNAVDAAVSAAAVLAVAEPPESGIGGDGCAIVWMGHELHGINGTGRSPAKLDGEPFTRQGPRSVTVPGVVAMWSDLALRFGSLGLDTCLQPAIQAAEAGVAITPRIASLWREAEREGRAPYRVPTVGDCWQVPALGSTLRRIAEVGPDGFYLGSVAQAIADTSWLSPEDLSRHHSEWVTPIRYAYRGIEICELPPNTQGVAALAALGIAETFTESDPVRQLHLEIEAAKSALALAHRYVADGPLPDDFLSRENLGAIARSLESSRTERPGLLPPARGDTSYLCCVDSDRNAVSLIQSLYEHFGSGLLAGDTGVVLQNRAFGFSSENDHPNSLGPAKRPYHTIIPGMILAAGELGGPFGVMGGAVQAPAHMQVVRHLVDRHMDPQAALDAGRFRVEVDRVLIEPGLSAFADPLRRMGHEVLVGTSPHPFGVGQIILVLGEALVGGSDGRGDGYVGGY